MNALDDLFGNGMREILESRVGVFPLFVYCFNDILTKRLYSGLVNDRRSDRGSEQLGGMHRNSIMHQIKRVSKIRPYLKNFLKSNPNVEKADVMFISRYRPVNINDRQRLKTDYLFNPVVKEVYKSPLRPKMAIVALWGQGRRYTDDRVSNFNLFDFLSLRSLFKSMFRSISLYFKYRKIVSRLSNAQKKMFSEFFSLPSLLFCHLLDFCLDKTIQNLKPKVIVANNEALPFKPYTTHESKLIVLQSALIAEQGERHRNLLFSSFLEDRLLSDYFCVSGSQSESLKQRFLKDTKRIVLTGQPRFDNLAKADELFDRNEIRRKFGLAADRKTLLWTTETHALSLEENKENISTVYDAVNSLENVQLVIKLHPAEDQEALLYRQDQSYSPIIVKGNQDVSELLYICDAMITKFSTTAIEAAILNKPIIVLNLSAEPDIMPYVEKGVAIGVYEKGALVSAIKDVIYKEEVRGKLAKGREEFVYEYAYLQDGKASERVANLMIQLIEETR